MRKSTCNCVTFDRTNWNNPLFCFVCIKKGSRILKIIPGNFTWNTKELDCSVMGLMVFSCLVLKLKNHHFKKKCWCQMPMSCSLVKHWTASLSLNCILEKSSALMGRMSNIIVWSLPAIEIVKFKLTLMTSTNCRALASLYVKCRA